MSWNAYLFDNRGHTEGEWNYTHNCNRMANAVLYPDQESPPLAQEIFGIGGPRPRSTWWDELNGLDGPTGAALLDRIIKGLKNDPDRFRAMDPDNGWGDYDSFVSCLCEMRDRVPEWPTKWETSG